MPSKQTIKVREIVTDIRSGMTAGELMNKYQLSRDKLQRVFRQLLDAGAAEKRELERLLPIPRARLDTAKRRHALRHPLFIGIPICDTANLLQEGRMLNVSPTGFQVSGIPTDVGHTKEFLVQADYFGDMLPFVCQAMCKWRAKDEDNAWLGGFEITKISDQGITELKKLISMITIS